MDHFSVFGRTKADQRDMFNKVAGNTRLQRQLGSGGRVADIVHSWDSGVTRWAIERQAYLLYGMTPAKGNAAKTPIIADNALPTAP